MSDKNENALLSKLREGWREGGWRYLGTVKTTFVHLVLITVWLLLDIGIKDQFLVGFLSGDALEYFPAISGYLIVAWAFYELYLKGRTKYPKRQAALWIFSTHPFMYAPYKDGIGFLVKFRIFAKTPD